MNLKSIILFLFVMLRISAVNGQPSAVNPQLLEGQWPAYWITDAKAAQREYGVYHFRKNFTLSALPSLFFVNVTADNRYRLFVNGKAVCSGPARGDLFNWFFETINIAPYLKAGENSIAAMVWNMGDLAPVAQVSNQTGFLVQGNSETEKVVNTDSSWKVFKSTAYQPCSLENGERLKVYMVVGPGDKVDGNLYPWGWENTDFDDQNWTAAKVITHPEPVGYGTDNRWTLSPRSIPLFNEIESRFPLSRRNIGVAANPGFVKGKSSLTIASGQKVSLLLDATENIAAYPELIVSGGKGAVVRMTYAESLFDAQGNKGNRNVIDGKEIKGNYDIFLPDGGELRKFRPLWFKAYRYLQLDIETGEFPLVLNDCYSMKTGYPLLMKASFTSSDPSLKDIWDVGWRTAKLCAGDLYYDTPYYEQLQYTGDSRIQALISLYTSGDDRLMRKAILDFYHSRTPEGLTQGRYPSNRLQIIPTFSLFWVSMVHDYWMHRKDDDFVRQFLPAINEIMEWYRSRIDPGKQMLGPLTWWNFVDWDNFDGWGAAPGTAKGNSSIVSLQYAYTLQQAADLFAAYEQSHHAAALKALAETINKGTYKHCFNSAKALIADTPDQLTYSQHANIWAILSGAVPQDEAQTLMKNLLKDKSIGQVTFFYRFYLTQALKKSGMSDLYYSELTPWREMLKLGLTTFAEKPEPTRSDCHAWSASPNYDFLATICGIMPDAPGFSKVLIKPALGPLEFVEGSIPHPSGKIELKLKRKAKNDLDGEVTLPEKLSGTFIWKNKSISLHGGRQSITIQAE